MAPAITPAREYLTARQLAQQLQVTAPTARRWARANLIPAVRIGRVLRFDRERVQAALESQTR